MDRYQLVLSLLLAPFFNFTLIKSVSYKYKKGDCVSSGGYRLLGFLAELGE